MEDDNVIDAVKPRPAESVTVIVPVPGALLFTITVNPSAT
jgi:hypothetical protein